MKSESKIRNGRRKLVCGQAILGGMVLSLFFYTAPIARAVDCNTNGIEDACDISCGAPAGPCDVAGCGLSEDCNTNGVPDECDIASGAIDLNHDGIPDSCVFSLPFERVRPCGNIFLAPDDATDYLRMFDRSGALLAIFDSVSLADISGPLSCDSEGNIMVPDWNNDRVLVISPTGTLVRTIAGGGLDGATAAAVTPQGSIAVCSYLSDTIRFYSATGTFLSNFGHFPGTQDPQSIIFDRAGNLYVGCRNNINPHVAKFDPQLQFVQFIGQGQLNQNCTDMAFDDNENLYVVTFGSIKKFAPNGTLLDTLGQAGLSPLGIAIDDTGILWVTNTSALNIYRFSPAGVFMDIVDISWAGAAGSLKLYGIAFDVRADADCNSNSTPDACDIENGTTDCDYDGAPDSCQIAGNDCNSNGTLDACEPDCDSDGTPDSCEIAAGAPDCNSNGIPDACDSAVFDQALHFDGHSDYSSAGNVSLLNLTNGITLEAWVRPDSTNGFHVIVSKGSGGASGYGFITLDGKLDFVAYGIQDYFTTGTYLSPGVWKHVSVVLDTGNDAHYYVNGQFVETVNGTFTPGVSGNTFLVGRTSLTGGEYWAGAIDEVRVWSVARTAQQIADNYAERLSGSESGLRAYWRFDEGSGQTAEDSSLNNLDATLGSSAQADTSDPTWIVTGTSLDPAGDCNTNGVLDECDIADSTSDDCNSNGIPDECDPATDCNTNSIQDICEPGGDNDCDGDGNSDLCEIVGGAPDCNSNQVPDACDVSTQSALDFDGSNDLVRVPQSASLEPANNLTIEAWIRPDSFGPSNCRIVRNQAGQGYILSWRQSGLSRLQLRIDKSTGGVAVTDTVDTNTYFGTWIHVAGVYSATSNFAGLYVNGVLKASTTASGPLLYSNSDVAIGNSTATSEGFDGVIDEVRIWNVARSGTQIAANMNKSFGTPQPGLVGYWKFEEASGQIAADSSGLANDGMIGSTTGADANDPTWTSAGSGSASTSDCDGNDVPDSCDLAGGANDCNSNGILDACEGDCNGNGIADDCDLSGGMPDCNSNDSPDACDIADGTSTDVNTDGIPDSCQPDVHVAPVITLINPSSTTETRSSLPTSASAIVRGSTYYVEIWASDVGTTNTGLTGVYVDLAFCTQSTANAVFHGNTFTVFSSGTISSGLVDEFGGSTFSGGIGNEPQWVRIGWIQMTSGSETPSCALALQPSVSGVAAFGRGDVDWNFVKLDSVNVEIQAPLKTYDLTGNGLINVGDFSLFSPSWQLGVPPANTAHDFDCDDVVGVGDLSWFATGWLKNTSDPSILYPPCPQAFAALERAVVATDIDMRLVVRTTPSGSDIAASLPASVSGVSVGSHYYVELWASDVGDINTGLTSGYVDVGLPPAGTTVANVFHGSTFTLFPTGTAGAGVVDELGGSALPGGTGVHPQWTRVAYVEMVADNTAPTVVYGLTPSTTGVAAKARGAIPWDQIALTGATLRQGLRGDIDGDGDVDAVDLDLFVAVLLETSMETSYRIAADFTGDGVTDGQDMQGFIPCYIGGGSCP